MPVDTDVALDTGLADTGLLDTDAGDQGDDPNEPPPCIDDGFEDNDDLDHALPLDSNAMMVLDGDPDFWRFELQPGQTRRVELTFDHSLGNIDLTVYNEVYLPVGTSYSFSDDEAVEVTNTSSVPTTARVRVILRDPGCNGYTVAVRPVGSGE